MVTGLAQPPIQFASMTILKEKVHCQEKEKQKESEEERERRRQNKQYELLSMIFWAATTCRLIVVSPLQTRSQ